MQITNNNLSNFFSFGDYTIRRIKGNDIYKVVDIINEAYSYQDKTIGEPRASAEYLLKVLLDTDFYVVEHDTEIIACFYIQPKNKSLNFGLLAVIPSYRGKGLVMEIIKAIESFARINKFDAIELEYTNISPWLKKYYEGYGFNETGKLKTWGPIELIGMKKVVGDESGK